MVMSIFFKSENYMSVKQLVIVITSFLILAASNIQAQLSGKILDFQTEEEIIGATIIISNTNKGTYSNEFGYFNLEIPKNAQSIQVSYTGYRTKIINLDSIDLKSELIIYIESNTNIIGDVQIIAERQQSFEIGKIYISPQEIEQTIQLGGEKDILKALQSTPGIKGGVEGTSGLLVRGGNSDQNLYLLEDISLYNTSHVFGLVSTFSGDNIKSLSLYKGGFPARYGGRLSSILDVKVKSGSPEKWEGQATLGILSSKLGASGPIIKDKWTISFLARRSFYDLIPLTQQLVNPNQQEPFYNFSDFFVKSNYKINQKNNISLFFYNSRDRWSRKSNFSSETFSQEESNVLAWGNRAASLTWKNRIASNIFQNVSVIYNSYQFDVDASTNNLPLNEDSFFSSNSYNSSVQDYSIKYRLDYQLNSRHYLRAGTEVINHNITPGQSRILNKINDTAILDTLSSNNDISNTEYRFFVEDEINFNRLNINAGLSFSGLSTVDKNYNSLEPRISAKYELNSKINIQASVVKMTQYLHVLSNNSLGLPTDLWIASTSRIPPSSSWTYSLGSEMKIDKNHTLNIEFYNKELTGLINYRAGSSFLLFGTDWEDRVISNGLGNSYGVEIQLKRSYKKLSGWLSYTYSRTDRQFQELNNGEAFPFNFDRPHELDILLSYKPNSKWSFNFNWKYHTGDAVTFPVGFYPNIFYDGELGGSGISNDLFELPSFSNFLLDPNSIPIYEGINQERLPDYHRLDISISRTILKKKYEHIINLSVYNLYNRKNTLFVVHGYDNSAISTVNAVRNLKGSLRSFNQFPIIPSLSYTVKF